MALVITLAQAEALAEGVNVEHQTPALSVLLSGIIPWAASSKLMAGVLKTQGTGSKMKVLKGKKCFSFNLPVVLLPLHLDHIFKIFLSFLFQN